MDLREGHGGWSPVHKKRGTKSLLPGNRTGHPPPPPVSESTFLALPTSYWGNVEIVIMTGAFDGGYPDAFKGRWATVCHAGAVQNCEGLGVVQPLSGVRLFATPWTAA